MIVASNEYEDQKEINEYGRTRRHKLNKRKRSLLQKFIDAILSDGETELTGHRKPLRIQNGRIREQDWF